MPELTNCPSFFRYALAKCGQLTAMAVLCLLMVVPTPLRSQADDPAACIKALRQGTLLLRIPTDKPKIDTLQAMANRSTNPDTKKKIEKQLQKAIEERDTLFSDYIEAFKNDYDFCSVGYYFDYEGKDLNTASYYNLDGERISVADLSEKPIFYLFFEHTTGSKIDALVVYDRSLRKIHPPFPNDFSRGGLNTIFLSISGRKFASWRVEKMNKQFHKYIQRVLSYEHYTNEKQDENKKP